MEVGGFAVGVISLGIEVCKGLLTFYQDWKGCPEDVQDACTSIEKLSKTFVLIQKSMNSPGLSQDNVQRVENCLFSCNEGVQKLKRKLDKIQVESPRTPKEKFKAATSRLTYPFKKSVVEKLKETTQELLQHLSLATQVLQLDVGISTQAGVEIINQKLEKLMSYDEERQLESALTWLSAPDPTINHEEATRKHEEGTGLWFLSSDTYTNWLEGKSQNLWLNGKAGCCKTILCSTIIEDIRARVEKEPEWILAYFYFSFSDSSKQTYKNLLLSFITQLSRTRPLHPDLEKAKKSQDRSVRTLEAVFSTLIQQMGQSIFVLDALDESPENDERESVMAGLQRLSQLSGSTKWLVTSRNETDIREFMTIWPAEALVIDEKCVNADINLYVAHEIERSPKLARLSAAVKMEIKDTFEKKADGMFRWAYCQLDEIKRLKLLRASYISRALNAMPRSLDETYERKLVSFEQVEEVKTALQWLAFSQRPLTVSELQEACITNFQYKPYIDSESRDVMDSLPDILSSLVRIQAPLQYYESGSNSDDSTSDTATSEGEYSSEVTSRVSLGKCIISLAHFSVKEYLLHDRISRSSAAGFALEARLTHYALAQTCVAYILGYHEIRSVTNTRDADLTSFPLLEYSTKYWVEHQRYVESSTGTISSQVNLHFHLLNFDDAKKTWLCLFDELDVLEEVDENEQPLYLATDFGLIKTVEYFLKLGMDVNNIAEDQRRPLIAACARGNGDIAEMLLHAGANPNLTNPNGATAFLQAASYGHEPVVHTLLRYKAAIDAEGSHTSGTALYAAVSGNNDKIAELLLQEGADVEAQGGIQETPLCKAALEESEKMVELLIRNGANVNAQGCKRGTALSVAASMGQKKMVELLLRKGADINVKIDQRAFYRSALHAAIIGDSMACTNILLAEGSDINLLPKELDTKSAACADLLIGYSVKNLRYVHNTWWKGRVRPVIDFNIKLTDEYGRPIREDGRWREDVPKDKLIEKSQDG